MARRPVNNNPETLRARLVDLLNDFEAKLKTGELREKVKALIPAFRQLRDLGSSLILQVDAPSARDRILYYFKQYPGIIIHGDELMVVSGIQEYARRVRELRVEFGWKIYTGMTMKEMAEDTINVSELSVYLNMKPEEYILVDKKVDKEAAWRWRVANDIRKKKIGARNKILEFLKTNVGNPVTGEELRYVSGGVMEWARRIRELRTEYGWSIQSKMTGRPDLAVGAYILESLTQLPEHDRKIPDLVRCAVLERDDFKCSECGWSYDRVNPADPRNYLELHHISHHVKGGDNSTGNLITLCNVCHDRKHSKN
ncbi:MAG: HNH endonuclease signature motif containing protein [Victivallales bacterium]